MKTILVTGGAGFIGCNFVRHLYRAYPDYRILVLDLLTYAGDVDNLPTDFHHQNQQIEFWYGDVRNASLAESLIKRSDVVVHFAAETHVTRSIFDNYHFFETDVLGTQTIANAVLRCADRVERFIHISTSEVYGTARSERMSEEHALMPLSPYASAKAGADRLVYSYFATYDIPAIIVRPFNNYGPRQHLEKVVPRFITSCLLGEPLRVHGDGSAMRDWTFVDDTCAALDAVMHADLRALRGEVVNIGAGESISIAEIARIVIRMMGASESLITYVGERPGQVFRHTADRSKACRMLGWQPRVDFEEGLKRTIDWYAGHRDWWQKQLWMREIPVVTRSGNQEMH
ncbi:MAG TPA: GDP-mannose 4,6-dehydratase [Vicinamibacterales bacterium]|nr:GDP-mannose 4,6-dehydratase [Vicinamibacterales bacterium]